MEFSYSVTNPGITTLHAITGSHHPQTMRIVGRVSLHEVVILIDSGSTHNSLDSSFTKTAELMVHKKDTISLRVQVADGEQVTSDGKCGGVRVELTKFSFIVEAFVIVLACCDMVLGIQWLLSLGSILWNFRDLTMEFTLRFYKA